MRRFVQNTVQK